MLLSSAAGMVYMERKVAAKIQQRMGPTLVGPYGLLQPLADIIKLAMKEDVRPTAADPILFALAPIISAATAFTAFQASKSRSRLAVTAGRPCHRQPCKRSPTRPSTNWPPGSPAKAANHCTETTLRFYRDNRGVVLCNGDEGG